MKLKLLLLLSLYFAAFSASAQDFLTGSVHENGRGTRLSNVFLHDINNNQLALTDKDGNFSIRTASGHTIIFNSPGYISDTLYVIDMKPKKINMSVLTIALRQVNITSSRSAGFDPRQEYPEVYQKSKVYVFSPSTWFGKEGKDARRLKRYFVTEEQERRIDEVFNPVYVGSLVPLKGQDLEDFMTMFRPSYDIVKGNNTETMAVYINDSYKKFMALPPEKRKSSQLPDVPVSQQTR